MTGKSCICTHIAGGARVTNAQCPVHYHEAASLNQRVRTPPGSGVYLNTVHYQIVNGERRGDIETCACEECDRVRRERAMNVGWAAGWAARDAEMRPIAALLGAMARRESQDPYRWLLTMGLDDNAALLCVAECNASKVNSIRAESS